MPYRVLITKKADRQFQDIPRHLQEAVDKRIQSLGNDPRPYGSIKLRGMSGHYRVRQGDYRIIYEIDDEMKIVSVVKIGDRKDVYE